MPLWRPEPRPAHFLWGRILTTITAATMAADSAAVEDSAGATRAAGSESLTQLGRPTGGTPLVFAWHLQTVMALSR